MIPSITQVRLRGKQKDAHDGKEELAVYGNLDKFGVQELLQLLQPLSHHIRVIDITDPDKAFELLPEASIGRKKHDTRLSLQSGAEGFGVDEIPIPAHFDQSRRTRKRS